MNIKVEKISNFTTIDNGIFQDRRLTNSARGLLVLMLSLPSDWDYSINGLIAICKEGRCAVRNALKELKDLGYLKINKLLPNQTNSNVFEYEYVIYEKAQDIESQDIENQGVDNQGVENRPLDSNPLNNNNKPPISNKILNNKELINNIKETKKENALKVLDYFNRKTGHNYRDTAVNMKFLLARLEDYTVDDLISVIDKKYKEWKGTNMEMYLRIETLFNATKFESYLNQAERTYYDKKPVEPEFEMRKYTQQEMDDIYFGSNNALNISDDDI